ncbi:NAD(P)-dependent iron-only hydrogenase diaphorase component flavoprotein [Desulforamulus reducens MI-1]|uniref:NAD(P)-dependent iron-only hydrogenase diaphorase component flavoprotein n=1 Tax=Desulforamulus reducens (strain ATCC BAA-1160 / DSM 100696 / MI-1) TaxID=349161 RepID=A4J9N8_DESRM|nr:NuoF family protein [Desulforamulus reducens]ABO51791.1 NAD(P)-dependent iron-only hydrogenase diaphorase component flavoprotein [Desulforamulus reducens MI-1]
MQIRSLEELNKIKQKSAGKIALRLHRDTTTTGKNILVCGGTGCHANESDKIIKILEALLKSRGMAEQVKVIRTGCFGFCEQGPIIKIEPDNVFYVRVGLKDAKAIVEEHIVNGRWVERLLYEDPQKKEKVNTQEEMTFYKKQLRVALRNCGLINPEDIYEYIAVGGYEALGKALTQMSRAEVIEIVKKSGLRGRGGGGFPTGLKWEITSKQEDEEKFIICNADEGDPGAFMDRSILEGDPHSVIEAMAIGAYAIGADKGIVYIRAEYPLAISRLTTALRQARELGVLGKGIFGTSFNFDVRLKYGAGAFVCGEETALINSCEGKRGEPNYKPPYPAEEGYWGHPTCVNNVETFANIPVIMTRGAEWFASIGTEKSKGTKVFALAGKINNVGLVEVPMGITFREIIFDIGGGIPHGKKFKAVQTGGPSGGVITEKGLDTPIDYDSLLEIGSMMGSGGMIVMDEDDNMVNIAKFYLEFTMDEACGRCVPGRIGTKRLFEMLHKITSGKATMADIDALKQLAYMVKDSSLCGLCQTAPNPVISTMKHFWHEYLAFVEDVDHPQGEGRYIPKNKIGLKS